MLAICSRLILLFVLFFVKTADRSRGAFDLHLDFVGYLKRVLKKDARRHFQVIMISLGHDPRHTSNRARFILLWIRPRAQPSRGKRVDVFVQPPSQHTSQSSNWEPIVTGVRRRRYLVSSRIRNTFIARTASTVNVRAHGNHVFCGLTLRALGFPTPSPPIATLTIYGTSRIPFWLRTKSRHLEHRPSLGSCVQSYTLYQTGTNSQSGQGTPKPLVTCGKSSREPP
jgi:hypothetical protein